MSKSTTMIDRLRAVSETGCDPDLPLEAANEIEKLSHRITVLEAESAAWHARFPKYQYRPQDGCVALI